MKKISVSLYGHKTSISLEPEFIQELNIISIRVNKTITSIITEIDTQRNTQTNLSSAIRIWILQQVKKTPK